MKVLRSTYKNVIAKSDCEYTFSLVLNHAAIVVIDFKLNFYSIR